MAPIHDSAHDKYEVDTHAKLEANKNDTSSDDETNVLNQTYGKGTWFQAGYHVATTIGTPAAFAPLAFAFALLGWEAGLISLLCAWGVAYYNSLLLAALHRYGGHRHVRFATVGRAIYGKGGEYTVIFFQQLASLGNNIGVQIAAGLAMKSIWRMYNDGNTTLKLWHFILFFGLFEWVLSQLPDIHSLRHINGLCTGATVVFCISVVGGAIYNAKDTRDSVSYSVVGDSETIAWNVLAGLGIVAFAFGDTILPEVQATIQDPPEKNMYKGVTMAFTLLISTYVPVAVSGYWAFGNTITPWLIDSFAGPKWLIIIANIAAIIQIVGCYQIYCRPTYEWIDIRIQRSDQGPFSRHNVLCRLLVTTIYIAIMTTIAAMIPFFGDFLALVGAVGFTPLDFVLPIMFYTKAKHPGPLLTAFNYTLAGIYSLIGVGAAASAIKLINDRLAVYDLFADL